MPTDMRYGGLRELTGKGTPECMSKLTRALAAHRPVKLLCVYREYCKESMLETLPGFLVLPSHCAVDADVFVVDTLADLDRIDNAQLAPGFARSMPLPLPAEAAAMTWCYGLGKIVGAKANVVKFMQEPTIANEARMLHFRAAVHAKLAGVLLLGFVAKTLGCGLLLRCA